MLYNIHTCSGHVEKFNYYNVIYEYVISLVDVVQDFSDMLGMLG